MKTSTRETIIVIFIVLFLAACTPAATPPGDTGQEELAPTLTLSATETPPLTETLTPTVTPIPPTPTFPAPEGADLPDSAVRSVNEQGQDVILDQPGGEPLWTLVEDEHGDLAWQKASDYEQDIAAALAERKAQEAVEYIEQAAESDSYESVQEVIAEIVLPMLKEQTLYSDSAWSRVAPRLSQASVNEQGQFQLTDEDGKVLFWQQDEGVSNVKWAIPPEELAYGFANEEMREKAIQRFETQFEGEARTSRRTGLYTLTAVLDNEILTGELELPGDIGISSLGLVYFYDEDRVLQRLGFPLFAYHANSPKFVNYSATKGLMKFDSGDELQDWVKRTRETAVNYESGPMLISGLSELKSGQIVNLGFNVSIASDLDDSAAKFFAATVPLCHSQDDLASFAESGKVRYLYQLSQVEEALLVNLSLTEITLFQAESRE
jgi:hypothetical protein